jgi:hypothetical protein
MAGRPSAVPGTQPQVNETWLATGATVTTGTTATKSRVRVPSFGTLIFLAFLAITGFRIVGEFVRGLELEPPPASTTAPGGAIAPGSIVFGLDSDGDCGVVDSASRFAPGTAVWWSAELSTEQAPEAEVVIIVRRDGIEVEREDVPPDPSFGTWSVLCSGKPIDETDAGLYRVEVWDKTITTLHAVGEYRLAAGG